MLLTEFQGNTLFRDACAPTPFGALGSDVAELPQLNLKFLVAAKAQMTSGGRGNARGVRRCELWKEMQNAFFAIMGVARSLAALPEVAGEAMNAVKNSAASAANQPV